MRPGGDQIGPRPRPRPQPRAEADFEATTELPRTPREDEPAPAPPPRSATGAGGRPGAMAERKPEPKPEPEDKEDKTAGSRRAQPARSRLDSRADARKAEAEARRRRKSRLTIAGGAVVAIAAVCLVPQVRTILRQSFTRLPQQSTAIYFTADPRVQGTLLDVPLTVKGVNTGKSIYDVKVWTDDAAGKVDASTTAKIPTVHGVTAAVVTLPIATDAAQVWVSLDGTGQTLHFQI